MANEQCDIRSDNKKKTRNYGSDDHASSRFNRPYGRTTAGNHAPNAESENSKNEHVKKPDNSARHKNNAVTPDHDAGKETKINPEDDVRRKVRDEQSRPCDEDPYIVKLFKSLMNPDDQRNTAQKRK